jgi:hypothetical protein
VDSDPDRDVDVLERSGRLQGRILHAFGHTAATEQMRRRLEHHGLRLATVLDNNPLKQGERLGGVPVVAPESVMEDERPSTVLIASRFHDEMRTQLRQMGYPGEIVRVGAFTIGGPDADAVRGAATLQRIRHAHPGRRLILCPFAALGDVYWALAYLPAFIARHRSPAPLVVVVGEGCREVAGLFGHADAECLSQAEMDDLVAAAASAPAPDVTIAHHDRPWGPAAPVQALRERLVRFPDLYRELVYGLAPQVPADPPSGGREHCAIPLPEGRTVLLAPHAKSVMPVAPSFWEQTARRCVARGYAVATLVHGDEAPVPGTAEVRIGIPQLLGAVERAGTFVALRSGLCDVVHTASACKIHVSPDAYYSTTRHKVADFFALPGWTSVVRPVG